MTPDVDLSPELAERRRAEKVQSALYRIAELASAAQDMQEFYRAVHAVVGELMHANNFFIALYDEERQLISWPYYVDANEFDLPDPNQWDAFGTGEARGTTAYVLRTGEPQLLTSERITELAEQGEIELLGFTSEDSSWLGVPLVAEGRTVGVVVVQSYTKEVQYSEQDKDLLAFVGQHVGAALSRARAIEETRQRNAELALINSVQEALAGELELQAIYDVVGDKIQEVFDAQVVDIGIYDEASGLLHFPYTIERGVRYPDEPLELIGYRKHAIETREPLLIAEDTAGAAERFGNPQVLTGEMAKSALFVPLVVGARATGVVSIQNVDREHAFTASDVQLLETLAQSLSVALENARLVHETRQRNAELALINSVQEAIAGELDQQAIYDVVGDKIQEIFDAQVVDIGIYDFKAGLTRYPYTIERGVRFPDEPVPMMRSPTTRRLLETKAPVLISDVPTWEQEHGEQTQVLQGEPALSVLIAPLTSGDEIRGRISLQNLDRTNAFSESDVRLLTTLAGSLSVALENARLVHETRQRNAELALINSVQSAIAGELDQQAIYDLVGDKIQEIFDAQVVAISTLEEATRTHHYPYIIERGERLRPDPIPLAGFSKHVLETGKSLMITENVATEAKRYGSVVVAGEMAKSVLYVPLVTAGRATGVVSLQNLDREHAFTESDQRLLATLAGSLSAALDNARLVHETRQRNAELALINSVQDGLAGELELQAIYDLVGDKIREVFDAQVVMIETIDDATGLLHFPYMIERAERLQADPIPLSGFAKHVLETREPLMINEDVADAAEKHGSSVVAGSWPKSVLFVPLLTGGRAAGVISLQNVDRERAFEDSDQRLLATLAGSLGSALDNARLVHETRQRNAELALINSVQAAIAGELDAQAIYDIVGDKIREVFDAQVVDIAVYDEVTRLLRFPYTIERGVRLPDEPIPLIGFRKHVMETGEPLMISEDTAAAAERYGNPLVRTTDVGEMPKSEVFVPLTVGGRATGVVSLQNLDREHAFTESDQRLLVTLAGSLSVALENARLVHETRQRNAELALINSVQAAIAGELDPQAIYDLVGDKIQEIFDAQVVTISILDEATALQHYPYFIERGERFEVDPRPAAGFGKHVLESGVPLLINDDYADAAKRYGSTVLAGEPPKSALFVPIFTAGRPAGVVSLQNVDREHAFTESDERLLATLAGSLSVALENARLVQETQQRVAELGTVNSVGHALAAQLDLDALIDLVGGKLQEVFEADIVYVALHDEAAGRIDFAYYSEDGERQEQAPMRYGEGLTSRILDSREPLLLNRSEQYEAVATARVGTPSLSYLGVPIFVREKAIGVVSVQSKREAGRFDESDERLLSTIAANLGSAIQNAQLYLETRRRANETAALAGLGREISAMLDLPSVLGRIAGRAQDLLEVETSVVYLADESGDTFHATVALGKNADEILADTIIPGEGIIGDLAARGAAEAVVDTNSDPRAVPIPGVGEQEENERLMAAPLLARERVIGMMAVWRYGGSPFTEDDLSFLIGLSQQGAIAIENARLFEAQSDAERQYRELVEELPLAVYRDEPVPMAASEYISPRVEQLFGYPREAWSDPEFFASILHPEDRDEAIAKHAAALARGDERWSFEYRLIAADGRTVFVRDDAWIVKDEDGKPVHVQGFMIDVTDQALAHVEIRRQKQYFESLVDVSPVAIVVMDAGERVTGWNPAATELFGWSAEEALGKRIDDLVFGHDSSEEGRDVTHEAQEAGRAHRIGRRTRRDGAVVDVELMLVPLNVDGEHVGYYAIYHDITELQHAREEAEAATQAKSAFLATMSHEIRTPMNAVIGMTDLLLGTELTPEQREFGEVVRSSGDALLHVIDDILDYSKIEAGKLELEREPFDLRECVEGALEIAAPRASDKEIELGCLIDEDAPAGIVGDAARLRQVLLNLISNAVKFTERGEVVVHVDAEPIRAGSFRLELAVRDTGIGIPQDRLDGLFTSFSQVDASTTRRYGGTGLGLAISKRLVELMGGTISVESEEGKGSTFRIALTADAADVPTRITHADGLPQLAGKRILVVDDNATNREIVTRHARSWGMEPVAFELPSEALADIQKGEPFDVAVLDMMMPGMDGIALAGEIRRHRSERELPFLLLTSLGRLPHARSTGAFAAQLAKPVRASQLYNALVRVVTTVDAPDAAEIVADLKPATSSLRILLAEDNAVNQMVALRLLEALGYGADVASNGLEALEALERQPYDVVLMDVQMPELDGLDASRRICERWPAEARPRIIAMTANALPEDREACFAAGMDDYVAKPIRPDELAEALRRTKPIRETRPRSDNGAEFDPAALESLRELGGDDFIAEVIDTFLADAPTMLETLRRCLEEDDAEELRRAAHTLKSNGSTLGAGAFSELCRELEQRAKTGQLVGASELVARIEQTYEPLREALAALGSKRVS